MTVCSVVAHDSADPAVVAAHASVDAGVSLHGAVVTPGHHSLQLTATHQRTARVALQTHKRQLIEGPSRNAGVPVGPCRLMWV